MTDIKSLDLQEITQLLREMGEPSFRGKQVFTWLHRGVTSFEEMSDLPQASAAKTGGALLHHRSHCGAQAGVPAWTARSNTCGELRDGNCIETVLMRYHHGNTVCISSQVGCRMGCAFCASTIAGKVRDLTPSEILDQVLFTQLDSGLAISNIVLMGIGEPLDNKDNVLKFLALVNQPQRAEHRHAAYQSVHLWHRAPDRRAGGAEFAADAVGVPPRAGQRDALPNHAGEPRL